MTKLVKTEVVSEGLAACDTDEAQALLSSAIESATYMLAGILRTSFDRAEHTHYYTMSSRDAMDRYATPLLLKLMNRFVVVGDPTPTFSLTTGSTWAAQDWTEMDVSKYQRKDSFGIITIMEHPSTDQGLLKVVYTAGFTTGADIVGKYYKEVPEWLQQACKLLAIHLYNTAVVAKSGKTLTAPNPMLKIPVSVTSILDPHIKVFNGALIAI